MVDTIEANLSDWEKHTLIKLPQYVMTQATYNSIVQCLKDLNENQRKILGKVLQNGVKKVSFFPHFKDDEDVKFLLAEGMIVVKSQTDRVTLVECAAPILRSMMLSRIRGPSIELNPQPADRENIDPKWLLARTIEVHDFSKLFIVSNETVCM